MMYYFGKLDKGPIGGGHHLHAPDGTKYMVWDETITPLGAKLDGGYCPDQKKGEPQGLATLTHDKGWTVLAFWDRSGDDRFGSNSAFLVEGIFTFEEMVEQAQAAFPSIWTRFTFAVRLMEEPQ